MINLNLIPPDKKQAIQKTFQLRNVWRWEIELSGIFLTCLFILISISHILNLNVKNTILDVSGKNGVDKLKKLEMEIKNANASITETEKIQKGQLNWSKLLLLINRDVNANINLGGIATKEYTVTVSGQASTRDDLVAFKERLDKEDCLAEVNLPLSNLVAKENLDFQIIFQIKPECLKL
ncbi:MAG: hypothetical protein NTZ97_01060 [Candidatus Moranbacteria bacterium]|nr:hypothetical protein [Candidatus Moranbacteria bacterium]